MRPNRRIRISILTAMAIVALVAVLLSWVAAERRKRAAALAAELQRSRDRVSWAERMHKRGYVSKATLAAERKSLEAVRSELRSLGAAADRQ
jgi:hypothetical protein